MFRRQALLLCAALCLGKAAAAEQLLTIYPLQSRTLEEQETQQLDRLLRSQAQYLGGMLIHSRAKTVRVVKRVAGAQGDCQNRFSCLVEVGELSAASVLVVGSAKRAGDRYRLDLKLIDISKEKIVNRAQAELSGNAREVAAQARELLTRLVQPQQFSGLLHVKMLVPGAHVLLDDLDVGRTPMDPIPGLKPRLYSLSILLEGCEPFQQQVQIRHATSTTVEIGVDGNKLNARVKQVSLIPSQPPPRVAQSVAASLRQPPASAAEAPPTSTEPEPEAVAATAPPPAPQPPPQHEAAVPSEPPLLRMGGILLTSSGAILTVFGIAGLASYGYGVSTAASSLNDGVVVDREAYLESQENRPLFTGLGLIGGITSPLGLAMLGTGIALYLLEEPQEEALE